MTLMELDGYGQTPVGQWKTIDDETGKAKSIVEIYEKDGKLYGKVVKLFREPSEEQNPICDDCDEDDQRNNKHVIGLVILEGLEFDGDDEWEDVVAPAGFTGDGDSLSIGGNHLAHILRRNLDVNILMFNNEIYGLTKGQYSPTSPVGTKKKSTPMGSIDRPFEPVQFALGSQATFVARTIDQDQKHMSKTLAAAAAHRGTSFIEVLQNCVIFNKDFYASTVEKKVRPERTIDLSPGNPLVYGGDSDKGLRFRGFEVERCAADEADVWHSDTQSPAPAVLLSGMRDDEQMPVPIGVFRNVEAPIYETGVHAQVEDAIARKGEGDLRDLVYAGEVWTVPADEA